MRLYSLDQFETRTISHVSVDHIVEHEAGCLAESTPVGEVENEQVLFKMNILND